MGLGLGFVFPVCVFFLWCLDREFATLGVSVMLADCIYMYIDVCVGVHLYASVSVYGHIDVYVFVVYVVYVVNVYIYMLFICAYIYIYICICISVHQGYADPRRCKLGVCFCTAASFHEACDPAGSMP